MKLNPAISINNFRAFLVRWILNKFEYPIDYAFLFTGAGLLLAIASIGFWKIKEAPLQNSNSTGIIKLFKSTPTEMRLNKILRNYILIINSLDFGISLSGIPRDKLIFLASTINIYCGFLFELSREVM
jgi:hypothetical protein